MNEPILNVEMSTEQKNFTSREIDTIIKFTLWIGIQLNGRGELTPMINFAVHFDRSIHGFG